MLLDHLVEDAAIIALNDGAVATRTATGLVDQPADARIVLRRDYHLLLHAVRHGLIALVPDVGRVLN